MVDKIRQILLENLEGDYEEMTKTAILVITLVMNELNSKTK